MGNKTIFLATLWNPNHYGPTHYESGGRAMARSLGYTVLNCQREEYPFQGWTSVLFLAESHMIFEAYPEEEIVELQIVTCKPGHLKDFLRAIYDAFGIADPGAAMVLHKDEDGYWK